MRVWQNVGGRGKGLNGVGWLRVGRGGREKEIEKRCDKTGKEDRKELLRQKGRIREVIRRGPGLRGELNEIQRKVEDME